MCRVMGEYAWSWAPNVRSVPRTQAEGPGEWVSVARPQVRTRDGLPLGTPPWGRDCQRDGEAAVHRRAQNGSERQSAGEPHVVPPAGGGSRLSSRFVAFVVCWGAWISQPAFSPCFSHDRPFLDRSKRLFWTPNRWVSTLPPNHSPLPLFLPTYFFSPFSGGDIRSHFSCCPFFFRM